MRSLPRLFFLLFLFLFLSNAAAAVPVAIATPAAADPGDCPPEGVAWRGDWPALSSAAVQDARHGVTASIELTGWTAAQFLAVRTGAGPALEDTLKAFLMLDDSVANLRVHHAYAKDLEMVAQVIVVMGTDIGAINCSSAFEYIATCETLRAELLQQANITFTAVGRRSPASINVDLASVTVRNFTPLDRGGVTAIAVLSGLFGLGSVVYLRLWKGGSKRVLCPVEETNWEQLDIRWEDVEGD